MQKIAKKKRKGFKEINSPVLNPFWRGVKIRHRFSACMKRRKHTPWVEWVGASWLLYNIMRIIAQTGVATSWCWQGWSVENLFTWWTWRHSNQRSLFIDAIDWMMFVAAHCCDQDRGTDFVTCRNLCWQCLLPISTTIYILKISEMRFVSKLSVSHPISPSCSRSRWTKMRMQLCCRGSVFGAGINMNANVIWSSDFELICIWCHAILCRHCADGAQEIIHDTRWDI